MVVVIGILAAITLVTYANVQVSARDATRKQDIATIKKQLLIYQAENGGVPATVTYSGNGPGGWDSSDRPNWLAFLVTRFGSVPKDPINESIPGSGADAGSGTYRVYFYYCYNAGGGALPATPNVALGYKSEKTGAAIRDNFAVERCL